MIPVTEAVNVAKNFGYSVFQKKGKIEEVEISGKYWLVTLSFEEKRNDELTEVNPKNFLAMLTPTIEKNYKIFTVDGETKEVVSAKMRRL